MRYSHKLTTLILFVFTLICIIPTAHAQTPTIACGTIDEQDGQITVPILIDIGDLETNAIQMEMAYTTSTLSNPVASMGADVNFEAGQATLDGSLYTAFGKSDGVLTGQIEYTVVTFDWTGDLYELTFKEGVLEGESGTLMCLNGLCTEIAGGSCNISAETLSTESVETGSGNINLILIGIVGLLIGLGAAILFRRSRTNE